MEVKPACGIDKSCEAQRHVHRDGSGPGFEDSLSVRSHWNCVILLIRGRRSSRLGSERDSARSVPCRRLSRGMQRLEKCNESRCLRRAQILAISWHVAATLDHLPNQLILSQPHGNGVECRPALSALIA